MPDRSELLHQATEMLTEVWYGHRAFVERQTEARGHFPGGGGGGTSKGSHSDPTSNAIDKRDPHSDTLRDFDRAVEDAYRKVLKLWMRYTRDAEPEQGIERMSDPGCELCAQLSTAQPVPTCRKCNAINPCRDHFGTSTVFSPTYLSTEFQMPGPHGRTVTVKRRCCYWDWRFLKRNGRVSTLEERRDHHEGRRVRVRQAG